MPKLYGGIYSILRILVQTSEPLFSASLGVAVVSITPSMSAFSGFAQLS